MLVAIMFFQHCSCITFIPGVQLKLQSYQNEILYGFTNSNNTDSSVAKCLENCIMNCACLSFQICGDTCQLCSSTKALSSPTSVQYREGCTRFEFENITELLVRRDGRPK